MSKHTPGPWEPLTFSNHELQTDFAMVKLGSRVHMVGYSDEDKANALLIAAAPEMLEALQQIIKMNRATAQDQFGDGEQAEKWACVTVARAAIAKATGGAPCQ